MTDKHRDEAEKDLRDISELRATCYDCLQKCINDNLKKDRLIEELIEICDSARSVLGEIQENKNGIVTKSYSKSIYKDTGVNTIDTPVWVLAGAERLKINKALENYKRKVGE